MNGFLDLKGRVGAGEQEDERDVLATKTALKKSGDYAPPGGRMSGWRDSETDDALKAVQRRNRIWPDGRMRPGGPTHRVINAERHERLTGTKPKGLGLSASVGPADSNRDGDVSRVQGALGQLGYLTKGTRETGFGPRTASATRMFQQDYNLKADGIAHPGGPTDTMLSRVSAPMQAVSTSTKPTRSVPAKPKVQKSTSPKDTPNLAQRALGKWAEAQLWGFSKAGELAGLENGTEYLNHFRKGSGRDRELKWVDAKKRKPVQEGVERNRGYFQKSFLDPNGNSSGYHKAILKMRDGAELKLPSDFWTAHFGWEDHRESGDLDEHVATGTSKVRSEAKDGFTAVRAGDRIHIFGTVEHRWDDDYDFGELTGEKWLDPSEYYSNVARLARDYGDAAEYETHAGGLETFRGEYRIENGRLLPITENWQEVGREVELR